MRENNRQRLDRRKEQQRSRYYDRALAPQPASQGRVVGFDADTGRHKVSVGGGVILAESLSNGAIELGSAVQISTARGSSQAAIDSMPR